MSKNIIICCDGTNNQFGKNNTNVAKLYDMIIADSEQLNYYDPGVGTSARNSFAALRYASNLAKQAFGLDLSKNVEEAYRFLMKNYEEGDKIFLFGFSRGAHTVRRLADVLGDYGLLHSGSHNMIPYVLRMYDRDEPDEIVKPFRRKFTRPCPVHFLGVWDTVSALSRLMPLSKLDGELNDDTLHAYHAVAIDEVRFQFPANLFKQKQDSRLVREEVWFAGVHSDVGGSYKERGLSDIALKWMAGKAVALGLRVYDDVLSEVKPNPRDIQHNSWSGLFWFTPWPMYFFMLWIALGLIQIPIALSGLFWPSLSLVRPFWDASALVSTYWNQSVVILLILMMNTRKVRKIPIGARVHETVRVRMEKMAGYKPKNLDKENVVWVE